ncbi:MAG: GNAT family N-acetyltransferase [Oricola sp.]|nr:GNAT family N-acetyltransferase [Oricola sp.]
MIQLIAPDYYGEFTDELQAMHRLRYRVFKERLDWDVQVSGDLELDRFDKLDPHYLLLRDCGGGVAGCVRLSISTSDGHHDCAENLFGEFALLVAFSL